MIAADEVVNRLIFPRGVLQLLKDTNPFGRAIDRAIEDIDAVVEAMGGKGET